VLVFELFLLTMHKSLNGRNEGMNISSDISSVVLAESVSSTSDLRSGSCNPVDSCRRCRTQQYSVSSHSRRAFHG